jgi:glycosyltransferase involved in cell wall biosynthesis
MIPTLSIIIPNYNHCDFLYQRIQSVLDQTFSDFELIILDDYSSDCSVNIINEFIEKDHRIAFYPSKNNSGNTFKQWNKGVSLAKAHLIWIAESDDFCDSTFIERTIQPLLNDDDIVISYCQTYEVDTFGAIKNSWAKWTDDLDDKFFLNDFQILVASYIKQFLIYRNTIPNASAVIFRKSIYTKIGNAPEFLHGNGDYLTWLKMLCYGSIAYNAAPLNYFRRHENSVIGILHVTKYHFSYQEQFDFKLRYTFHKFLKKMQIPALKDCIFTNQYYMSLDKGNKGLFFLKNRQYLRGIYFIIQASFYPVIQSGFIKRAFSIK